jgi:hypothetical protein
VERTGRDPFLESVTPTFPWDAVLCFKIAVISWICFDLFLSIGQNGNLSPLRSSLISPFSVRPVSSFAEVDKNKMQQQRDNRVQVIFIVKSRLKMKINCISFMYITLFRFDSSIIVLLNWSRCDRWSYWYMMMGNIYFATFSFFASSLSSV